ncbi:hypothetical protein Tsubulata_001781 [Turnera subulata]|uniref:Uncharacterized protein n=1 Tax=Turnera subulata TaxID=218843 RepID=A0A9Q0J648_9ROSI|nr:hypothetical protein Tsubulata_001781 [Turnera subulata]
MLVIENVAEEERDHYTEREREMGILYGMVARGRVVLAEFSATQTNANAIAREVLEKSPAGNNDGNASYSHDRYIFHVKRTDGLTVLCMAEDSSGRRIPFAFLEDIHQRFVKTYGRAIQSAAPYAMNDEFSRIIAQQMEHYSNNPTADRLDRLKGEMSQVRSVMIDNIDKVLDRGDRLALLVEKTSSLEGNSVRFRRQSRRYRNNVWWQNVKLIDVHALGVGDNFGGADQIREERNIALPRGAGVADIENPGHSSMKIVSSKGGVCSANTVIEDGRRNENSGVSGQSLNKKRKSQVGKSATTAAEKLWDGSLQLNSSVTVSAVAFFKSGEKMPDVKWSEFLEVKGKVKLDAFEKYIQDLPRSRSRGLMVAKGYRKRDIVSLAQLSKGIDLYICPRSDAIITILAKHGFFKGMAAVEDKQDSLIGCVVWRRNQTASNCIANKTEKKDCSLPEKPLTSPTNSVTGSKERKDTSHVQLAKKCTQVTPTTDCTTLDGAGNNDLDPKVAVSRQLQPELHTSSNNASLLLGSLLSHLPANQNASISDSVAVSVSGKPSLHVETPPSLHEKPKPTPVFHRPGLPLPSNVPKGHLATPDDDLPEFDFGTACDVSQSPASKLSGSDIAKIEKRLLVLAEGYTQGSTERYRMMGTGHPILASKHNRFGQFSNPRLPVDVLERLPNQEEKYAAQSRMPVANTAIPRRKNLFDDEDDMPEWCPPNIEIDKQLAPGSRPPISTFSKVLKSSHEKVPPSRLLPSLSEASYPPVFTRASHFPASCQDVNPAQPRSSGEHVLRGSNSLTGVDTNPLLRPPVNPLDPIMPVHRPDWRGRGP